MPSVTIAYRTLGLLAPDRGNVVLVTHGNTGGPQMIDPGGSTGEGSWNEIVGPGKAVDTDRFFVICPNMLGSSYGSTNAASIDPMTGKRYGPRFPEITVSDIVATQRALLDHLGIDCGHRHISGGAARTVGRKCSAAARHAISGPELERRRLL